MANDSSNKELEMLKRIRASLQGLNVMLEAIERDLETMDDNWERAAQGNERWTHFFNQVSQVPLG